MVTLWPTAEPREFPLYFVAFVFLAAGFLLGTLITWISMGKLRRERRQQKKTIKKLEKDIDEANKKLIDTLAKMTPEKYHAITHEEDDDA